MGFLFLASSSLEQWSTAVSKFGHSVAKTLYPFVIRDLYQGWTCSRAVYLAVGKFSASHFGHRKLFVSKKKKKEETFVDAYRLLKSISSFSIFIVRYHHTPGPLVRKEMKKDHKVWVGLDRCRYDCCKRVVFLVSL